MVKLILSQCCTTQTPLGSYYSSESSGFSTPAAWTSFSASKTSLMLMV